MLGQQSMKYIEVMVKKYIGKINVLVVLSNKLIVVGIVVAARKCFRLVKT
jgi:hypothetical protein